LKKLKEWPNILKNGKKLKKRPKIEKIAKN